MTALRMLRHPGVACVVRYRLQCFFYSNGLAPFGKLLKFLNLILYGVQIDEGTRIGGGFYMGHAVTILITGAVTIGERCVLFHQNTIGISPFFEPGRVSGPLVIGNDVTFGGGACAYGNIVIGDRCRIGVNAVVDQSFPAGSVLFGVPARVVSRVSE
jgi:serine O-acetyltransferase